MLSPYVRYLPRFLFTVVTVFVATVILAPPILVVSLFTKGGPAYRMASFWTWIVAKSMGVSCSLYGAEKIVPGTSYIITPNHQSNADILALYTMLPCPFRWVLKRELLRIPLFGWALAATGAISINRADRSQAVRKLQEAPEKLKGGWSVLIYPEGTRTSDGRLQAFKKGAFMMAVQTGIPILPVTCNGAFKVMPKKKAFFRPGHITLTVGDPIPTTGLTEADVPELMERTRQAISSNLDENYDPFA